MQCNLIQADRPAAAQRKIVKAAIERALHQLDLALATAACAPQGVIFDLEDAQAALSSADQRMREAG